jgi:predicted GIY-YIG superfamily endonuclease
MGKSYDQLSLEDRIALAQLRDEGLLDPANRCSSGSLAIDGFTKRYRIYRLVLFEVDWNVSAAIRREKCIKKWQRSWKLYLIEAMNPHWDDLYDSLQ